MTSMKNIAVFCASSEEVSSIYLDAATQLGKDIAKSNNTLLYGGGSIGLMGKAADATLANNGNVIGVIPHFMMEREWNHPKVKDMRITDTMAERKAMFWKMADAMVTLPGGIGTLEELIEGISLIKLDRISCPMVIVNIDGYFDPILSMFAKAHQEKFMHDRYEDLWHVVSNAEEVIPLLNRLWQQNT